MSNISRNRRDFLVALLKNDDDFAILIQKGWYRIPLKTKRIPLEVKSNEVKYIGFYHNLQSKFYPAQIKYYGRVKNISVVRRKELFPEEIKNPKTENLYLKIEVQKMKELEEPIISRRRRRILFIMTTYEKFIVAEEINHLYKESSIEERMYEWMREADLEVERQFLLKINSRFFILDFALFCTKKTLI